jgi:hypothetical protein
LGSQKPYRQAILRAMRPAPASYDDLVATALLEGWTYNAYLPSREEKRWLARFVDRRKLEEGGTGRTCEGISTEDLYAAACKAWDAREAILAGADRSGA